MIEHDIPPALPEHPDVPEAAVGLHIVTVEETHTGEVRIEAYNSHICNDMCMRLDVDDHRTCPSCGSISFTVAPDSTLLGDS